MHNYTIGETEKFFFCATGFLDEFKPEEEEYQGKHYLYKLWKGDIGWQEDILRSAPRLSIFVRRG